MLGIGGCLGEGALLSAAARSATATAVEDTGLLALDRQSFQLILDSYPQVQTALNHLHQVRTTTPFADSVAPMPATS